MTDLARRVALAEAEEDRPDADDARLVVADALQEQGDPRGELISIQCATARLGLGPPRLFAEWLRDGLAAADKTSEAVQRLLRREQELLRAHGTAWAGGAATLAPNAWVFRRGFVEQLGLGRRAQTLDAAVDAAPLLETLHQTAAWDDPLAIRTYFDVPAARRLRELYLPDAGRQLSSVARVRALAGLRRLLLNHAGGPHDAVGLAGATFTEALRGLVLSSFKVDPSTVRAFAGFSGLVELQLVDTRLGVAGAGALGGLALPALEVLAVRHGKIGDEGARSLRQAPWASRLRALDLRKNALGDVGGLLEACPSLAVLELSGNPLGESLAGWISAPAHALDVLGLEGCGLVDADVAALVASPAWARIGVLDLRKNALTDAAARAIEKAPAPRLRALYVGGNRFGAAAKKALAALPCRVFS